MDSKDWGWVLCGAYPEVLDELLESGALARQRLQDDLGQLAATGRVDQPPLQRRPKIAGELGRERLDVARLEIRGHALGPPPLLRHVGLLEREALRAGRSSTEVRGWQVRVG